jgi:opacity protein-like surface antigen
MKPLFTTLLTTFLFTTTAFSQENKFQVGIDGGPSSTFVFGFEHPLGDDFLVPMVGFSTSVTFQYNFKEKLSLVSGVGFERKGVETKDKLYLTDEFGNPLGPYIGRNNYNYINIPLMLKYTLGDNQLRFYGSVGGYLGLLMKSEFELVGYDNPNKDEADNTDEMQNVDFGFSAGLGVQYSLSDKIGLSLEVRNNMGVYNISKLPIYNEGTNKLNSTNLLIGVNYGFGN